MNEKKSFTPGPWSYNRLDHRVVLNKDDFEITAFNNLACGTVAYLYDQNWSGTGGEKDIANARLIAAAPDLFDFVIQYLYSEHGVCAPHHAAAPYSKEELKRMAEELIAKVEGRE